MLRSDSNGFFTWKRSLIWKLILINGLVIGVVIWITGVSVKDFACFLVNQYRFSDDVEKGLFNSTMQNYLLRASIIAVTAAAVIHYFFVRRIVKRLKQLAVFARQLTKGHYPETIKESSQDEIGQLTKDFNQLVRTLQQVEESRKQMISDISHELRTPLSNINGYLEALSEGVIEGSQEIYRSLHNESMHLTYLVDQLHQLSAWGAKKLSEPNLQEVNIQLFVEACIQHFEMELKSKKISSHIDLQPAVVLADQVGLKQIMNNLLKNAIQYDEGGFIEIDGELTANEYRIKITNEGRSIPPEKSEQIFERFYRLESSRNRETGGSGLGLAIVKEIVKRHGGRVGLITDGKRHTFWFSLPIKKP